MQPFAIYDIVITQPIDLMGVTIDAVNHPRCVAGTCPGMRLKQSRQKLADIAVEEFNYWLSESEEYKKLFRRFGILDGQHVELFDPDDIE